tara:strand:- start:97 stop:300 length:204 start_codon:yes stop_codon:yes gene_type:complete
MRDGGVLLGVTAMLLLATFTTTPWVTRFQPASAPVAGANIRTAASPARKYIFIFNDVDYTALSKSGN